jgi:hypothetical protein
MDHEITRAASPAALAGNRHFAEIVSQAQAEPLQTDESDRRWMRDLLILQVTSLFSAGLFVVVWLMH